MFTGRQFDIETGLYYYRARYYNPYLGRFLQTDPVGCGYTYRGNRPVSLLDPSGQSPIPVPIPAPCLWPWPKTITSGAPTTMMLLIQAVVGYGGKLTYTDSAACWNWVISGSGFLWSFVDETSDFLLGFWAYARHNCYDIYTNTFHIDPNNWNYEHPLTGTYISPEYLREELKPHFNSEEYTPLSPYWWIDNFRIKMVNYLISIWEGGCSITADFRMIDWMDLHPMRHWQDFLMSLAARLGRVVTGRWACYMPYDLEVYLGTHTIAWTIAGGDALDGGAFPKDWIDFNPKPD